MIQRYLSKLQKSAVGASNSGLKGERKITQKVGSGLETNKSLWFKNSPLLDVYTYNL
jgi:hypothetical protein